MTISELSIRRPVVASVLCLLLLFIGLLFATRLPVREMPLTDPPYVNINTTYRGASAAIVETKITQLIEDSVAGLEGIDKLTSTSSDERSRVNLQFTLDRDIDEAANDVRDRISRLASALPQEADAPQISKADANAQPIMWINLRSTELSVIELTDYAERNIVDRFAVVPGVAGVNINGARRPAMRIWLDRQALAARQLTVDDIEAALRRENIELPAGRIESTDREFTLRTDTRLQNEAQFRNLPIGRGTDGYLVRLSEVADVRLSSDNERTASRYDGLPGILFSIQQQATANSLAVADGVSEKVEEIASGLPQHMRLQVVNDNGAFIKASLREVLYALVFSLACVLIVIYTFIGSWRATLIPAITIPVSIIATCIVMSAMG